MLNVSNKESIWSEFIRDNKFQDLAEVGVWKGQFAEKILNECSNIKKYYMIDSWRHIDGWNKPFNVSDEEFKKIYNEALYRTSFAGDKIFVLKGTTLEVRSKLEDESLDFIYIDGDHSLRGIVIDAISMWPKIRAGGVLAGDDFTESVWQHSREYEPSLVNPFMRYFADAVGEKICILPNNQYYIRKTRLNGYGCCSPESMKSPLLPLLNIPQINKKQKPLSVFKYNAINIFAAALFRRVSRRFAEYEQISQHGEQFPSHFLKLGVGFIHVPKCAGTSINLALYGKTGNHISLNEVFTKFPFSSTKIKTCSVFRDPTERFISAFYFLKKGGLNGVDRHFAVTNLKNYETPSELAEAMISGEEHSIILKYPHFKPQVGWISHFKSKSVVDCLVLISQLELLKKWLQDVTDKNFDFPKSNVASGFSSSNHKLSSMATDVLNCIYKDDYRVCEMLLHHKGCMISDPKVPSGRNHCLKNILFTK